ncbi:MAG: energy-coupled thiamine transporter ThiT [Agathobaculum sp.]|uniref:energy-coupled thiamine transporter ThiT n=1 Tax=Agathobaculum sp. TaxID=2048138 RepID=UPI0025BD87C3|nr:energy-coupled thiamine transporter ThiT [Agathobaculum sp.]MCI7125481.1 energy-coupled thiamine transporter ThiT [Agathobaculum sp.]
MISATVTTVFTVSYLLFTLWLCRGLRLTAKSICLAGLCTALTLVLNSIMIPLPTGSTFNFGSMLPLMLLALVYDYRLAMVSGWLCGVLALFLLPAWQPVHWAQVFVEHLVCFSCLGYAGVFGSDKRWKILYGALLSVFLSAVGHVLSGVIFFSQNAWDGWGAWGYSLAYNLSSKIPEGILTILILLALPLSALKKAAKEGTQT